MDILEYLTKEFPEVKRPYLVVDAHPDNETSLFKVRSLIFPRPGPLGTGNIVWPVVFVAKEKLSQLYAR